MRFLSLWVINEEDEDLMMAEALRQYRSKHGYSYRKDMHDIAAETLVDTGKAEDLNAAKEILRVNGVKHRPSLDWCRNNSERYIAQLNDQEFRGLFRMSRDKFDEILGHMTFYFPKVHVAGKAPIPVKFLLAGTLRWLAGGSPHDIIYFCGMRARYLLPCFIPCVLV